MTPPDSQKSPAQRSASRSYRGITRRQLLAAVPGLALLTAVAACGGDDDDTPATSTTAAMSATSAASTTETAAEATPALSGEWTFTDDRGVTITLPQRPERIVPYLPIAASLWDFGVRPVGVFGTTRREDGTPEIYAGSVDLDEVESLGEIYGEIDMEMLVALKPDLILFDMYSDEVDVWGLPADMLAQVEQIAPICGISFVARPVTETIGRIEELAASIGADLSAPEIVEARQRFDQAAADVQAATAEKPELTSLFVAGWTDNLYIATPGYWADLLYFQELGLNIVAPDVPPEDLWETLSWEQAGKYQADLILNDARNGSVTEEDLNAIATWASQPAVQADQVGPWFTEFVPSYAGFTRVLESLATTIKESRDDVVS